MLGYCTNVHSGSSFKDVILNLQRYGKEVRNKCKFPIGIGLWLSDVASREVDIPLLKDTLSECELVLFTMNGFPFFDFHDAIVQRNVYKPHWGDERRLEYTIRLATILASLVDTDQAGISTLPIGWNSSSCTNNDAAEMFRLCIDQLETIENQTGRCIHLDIETEPGCRLQRASDLCAFVGKHFGDDENIRRYLRVCHDTCHGAVMHEAAEEAVTHYNNVGLKIGKVQLSSAIQVNFDDVTKQEYQQTISELQSLDEPRYLHQTNVDNGNGIEFFDTFHEAPLAQLFGRWRVHFHVPIHLKHLGMLQTTQDELLRSIPILKDAGVTTWEVETYTWDVVPSTMKEGELVDSIAKELTWAAQHINQ